MPWKIVDFSLVTSPTRKGVILIGILNPDDLQGIIMELLPDDSNSITKLKWTTILKEKLSHPRFRCCMSHTTFKHISFPISNEVFNNLTKDYSNCYIDRVDQDLLHPLILPIIYILGLIMIFVLCSSMINIYSPGVIYGSMLLMLFSTIIMIIIVIIERNRP